MRTRLLFWQQWAIDNFKCFHIEKKGNQKTIYIYIYLYFFNYLFIKEKKLIGSDGPLYCSYQMERADIYLLPAEGLQVAI